MAVCKVELLVLEERILIKNIVDLKKRLKFDTKTMECGLADVISECVLVK